MAHEPAEVYVDLTAAKHENFESKPQPDYGDFVVEQQHRVEEPTEATDGDARQRTARS